MRVQTEEWRRFIPGVRMYKGKKTYFYNGEILYDEESEEYLVYVEEERKSWEVIIVLPGVEVIPEWTFRCCGRVTTVIMSDSVVEIEKMAFVGCISLVFVRLSTTLICIGREAFADCHSLISIFIPPSCTEIRDWAFASCEDFINFHVPQDTRIGNCVIANTSLLESCSMEIGEIVSYRFYNESEEVNEWIKNINIDEEYELHRACSSFNPIEDIVYGIVKRKGLRAFKVPNKIGFTPARYLEANPYSDIDQQKLIKRYIAEMMGETI